MVASEGRASQKDRTVVAADDSVALPQPCSERLVDLKE